MLQYVAAAAAVASTAANIFGSLSSASEAKKAARRQSKQVYRQRMEEIRRTQVQQALTEGTATARAYASNIMMSGSTERHLKWMKSEHSREIAYAEQMALQERRNIRASGDTPALGATIIGQAASGISNAIGGYKAAS